MKSVRLKPNKSARQIYWLLFFISLFVSIIVYLIIKSTTLPFYFKVKNKVPIANEKRFKYHDFDNDGLSEMVTWSYKTFYTKREIQVINANGGLIDQFNFDGYSGPDWIFFADYDDDLYDEIFVFTTENDSVFLSVVDVKNKTYVFKRQLLVQAPENYPNDNWDVRINPGGLLDTDNDGEKELIFAISAGYALYPRSVYIFDLAKLSIEKEFATSTPLFYPFFFDLNKDGKKEIITSGTASGNIFANEPPYNDQQSWLFILDQELRPVFTPQKFSRYPSSKNVAPVIIKNEPYLVVFSMYKGPENEPSQLFLINSKGEIEKQKNIEKIKGSFFIDYVENRPCFYILSHDAGTIKLNSNLDIVKRDIRLNHVSPVLLKKITNDGMNGILSLYNNKLSLYNTNLELIASCDFEEDRMTDVSLKKTGFNQQNQLLVNGNKNIYRLQITESFIYSFLYLIAIGLCLAIFFLLIVFYKLISFLLIYFNGYQYSLVKSPHGIMILDPNARVFYLNGRFQSLINSSHPISKRQHYSDALRDLPEVKALVDLTIRQKIQNSIEIVQHNTDGIKKLQITALPLPKQIPLLETYIIEIQDVTKPVMSDRAKVWSKSMQKITHDIKTPLSTIQLNLKTLQMRLATIPLDQREEIDDDMEMMRIELERVRSLAKNFLKFSNLDKPNFQPTDVNELVSSVVKQFENYINEKMDIRFETDGAIKKIQLDCQQIKIVLDILIENAIDALQGEGLIKITAGLAQLLEREGCNFLEIEVADSGAGIETKIKNEIFEPYFTTKKDGTGMGLAIAKKIIEDHGGEIGLYSKDGFGTVVRFVIPVG